MAQKLARVVTCGRFFGVNQSRLFFADKNVKNVATKIALCRFTYKSGIFLVATSAAIR